jgi:hypothetical protein
MVGSNCLTGRCHSLMEFVLFQCCLVLLKPPFLIQAISGFHWLKKPKLPRSGCGRIDMISKCHRWTALLSCVKFTNSKGDGLAGRFRPSLWQPMLDKLTSNRRSPLGFWDHLPKPARSAEIMKIVARLCGPNGKTSA